MTKLFGILYCAAVLGAQTRIPGPAWVQPAGDHSAAKGLLLLDKDGVAGLGFVSPAAAPSGQHYWELPDNDSAGCFQSDGAWKLSINACGTGGVAGGFFVTGKTTVAPPSTAVGLQVWYDPLTHVSNLRSYDAVGGLSVIVIGATAINSAADVSFGSISGTGLNLNTGITAGGSINLSGLSSAYQMGGVTVIDHLKNATVHDLTISGTCTGCGAVSSLNTLTGALTLAGTANQVIVTPSGGNTLTLTTPQDIGPSSNVSFGSIAGTGLSLNTGITAGGSINLTGLSSAYQMGGVTVIDHLKNATVHDITITGTCVGCSSAGVSSINLLSGTLTLAGTANQVIVTPSGGNTLTLTTPQDIGPSSNVSFGSIAGAGLSLNTGMTAGGSVNLTGLSSAYQMGGVTVIDHLKNATVHDLTISGTCVGCLSAGVSSLNSLSGNLTLAGTANQVIVTPSGGNTLTLTTPQDIGPSSNVSFGSIAGTGLSLTSGITAAGSINLTGLSSAYQIGGVTVIDHLKNATVHDLTITGSCSACSSAANMMTTDTAQNVTATKTFTVNQSFQSGINFQILPGGGTQWREQSDVANQLRWYNATSALRMYLDDGGFSPAGGSGATLVGPTILGQPYQPNSPAIQARGMTSQSADIFQVQDVASNTFLAVTASGLTRLGRPPASTVSGVQSTLQTAWQATSNSPHAFVHDTYANGTGNTTAFSTLIFRRCDGSVATCDGVGHGTHSGGGSAIGNGEPIGSFGARGYDDTGWENTNFGSIVFQATQDHTSAFHGTAVILQATSNVGFAGRQNVLTLSPDGSTFAFPVSFTERVTFSGGLETSSTSPPLPASGVISLYNLGGNIAVKYSDGTSVNLAGIGTCPPGQFVTSTTAAHTSTDVICGTPPSASGGITSINSQTGPAVAFVNGTGTTVAVASNNFQINIGQDVGPSANVSFGSIAGTGLSLTSGITAAGSINLTGLGSGYQMRGTLVINSSSQFVGNGVNVGSNGISAGGYNVSGGFIGQTATISGLGCGSLHFNGGIFTGCF